MTPIHESARRLSRLLLAGPLALPSASERVRDVLGRKPGWLDPLVRKALLRFGEGSRPRLLRLAHLIAVHRPFARSVLAGHVAFPVPPPEAVMCPADGAPQGWPVPSLPTVGELARWLRVSAGELDWFADLHRWNTREPLGHYRHRWDTKPDGGARLIESPKLRIKFLHRQILRGILDRIPPHESAHGFRAGRSIHSFVAPHVGRHIALRLDLRDFFPSITRARITAIFLTAGYPEPVALRLAGICTIATPNHILDGWPSSGDPGRDHLRRKRHAIPHLPQGAPTSPALANLAVHRLDCRLAGLARAAGAAYTRYADDLLFSGDAEFARMAERFGVQVGVIALEEGFEINARKTRVMRRGVSQRAAGMVLNVRANIPRRDFDRLKAVLHNCMKLGPSSQNRAGHADFRAHLQGRVAHISRIHPARGERLQAMFERIRWDA